MSLQASCVLRRARPTAWRSRCFNRSPSIKSPPNWRTSCSSGATTSIKRSRSWPTQAVSPPLWAVVLRCSEILMIGRVWHWTLVTVLDERSKYLSLKTMMRLTFWGRKSRFWATKIQTSKIRSPTSKTTCDPRQPPKFKTFWARRTHTSKPF